MAISSAVLRRGKARSKRSEVRATNEAGGNGGSEMIRIKRVYEPPGDDDGLRVLVDRLWPRGLSKAAASTDLWVKELAPTTTLRRWFGHEESRFEEFRARYLEELEKNRRHALDLLARARGRTLTLLFAARDRSRNHAVVLRDFLTGL